MHKFIVPALLVAIASILPADVLRLRDGRSLNGRMITASSRQIQFQEDGQRTAKSYSLTNVDRVSFGNYDRGGRLVRYVERTCNKSCTNRRLLHPCRICHSPADDRFREFRQDGRRRHL